MSKKKLITITLLVIVGISVFSVILVPKFMFRDDWDFWVEKQTDFSIEQKLTAAKRSNRVIPDEYIAKIRKKMRDELKTDAAGLKEILSEPPPLMKKSFQFEYEQNMPQKYEGPWPQTAESVLAAFAGLENHRDDYEDEVDAKFPPAKWIARLLDRGAIFEHYRDYSSYMNSRRTLIGMENDPEAWQSGGLGITPAKDWETFQDNYIDREIWEVQQYNAAKKADPNVRGGTFMGPNKSVFLPFNGNNVYIDQSDGTFASFGASLTIPEIRDLMFKGTHPEGLEVIYIDKEEGVFLHEEPPLLSWEAILEKAGPPPLGWENNLPEGWDPPPELIEVINNKYKVSDTVSPPLPDDPRIPPEPMSENVPIKDSRQDAWDFTTEEEGFLEWLTEYEMGLESDFDVQLESFLKEEGLIVPPEADFEKEIRNRFKADVITPTILDKAIETLERDGLTDGLRKLQKEDPEVAKVIAELIGARHQQRKSLRDTPLPIPPDPSTSPEPEED